MPDIATLWNTVRGDWGLSGADLAKGNDLVTAALVSLFTDRRAGPDDVPPDGTEDPRGWWADDASSPIGSRLWLLARAKRTDAVLNAAIAYANESLAWMLEDGVASRIDVRAEWSAAHTLGVWVVIYAPKGSTPIARIGTQNVFDLASVEAWSWNPDQNAGAWKPIPPTPPPFVSTVLLLHLQGANGGTSFPDSSSNAAVATIVNSASNGPTETQTVVGGPYTGQNSSLWNPYDAAHGGAIYFPAIAAYDIGTQDFDIEFSIYIPPSEYVGDQWIVGNLESPNPSGPSVSGGFIVSLNTVGFTPNMSFWYSSGGTFNALGFNVTVGAIPAVFLQGVWHKCCFERSAGIMTLYVDGVGYSPQAVPSIDPSAFPMVVGTAYYGGYGWGPQNGGIWIAEVRLSIGRARYKGNYTPSATPLLAD